MSRFAALALLLAAGLAPMAEARTEYRPVSQCELNEHYLTLVGRKIQFTGNILMNRHVVMIMGDGCPNGLAIGRIQPGAPGGPELSRLLDSVKFHMEGQKWRARVTVSGTLAYHPNRLFGGVNIEIEAVDRLEMLDGQPGPRG